MDNDRLRLLLELETWEAATSGERLASVLAVAATLPESFVFDQLATHALGEQSHELAFFEHSGCTFALVPGRLDAVLGYDRSRPYRPTKAQADDWEDVHEEYGCTIEEYLDECLGPLRHATVAPLLIETVARPHDYHQSGDDQGEGYARVREFCGPGFRLPTPDEWEYACSGGARTLFRWGDECPVSNSYKDKEFKLHERPNAFGLTMNPSTYDCEICEGPVMRGGDGGGSVCGGIGKVITWFPLASSFRVSDEEINGWWIDQVFVRRVRPIIPEIAG
jgi:hypothetical protein